MKAIGCYLLIIISLAGMSLTDDEEDKKQFLDHIFYLHNMYRTINELKPLTLNNEMNNIGHWLLTNKSFDMNKFFESYGWNYYSNTNNNTKLDQETAEFIFSGWHFNNFNNFYPDNPLNPKADAYKHILWEGTTDIGLAVEWNNNNYSVIVIYFPRYNKDTQVTPKVPKPSIFPHGKPSITKLFIR